MISSELTTWALCLAKAAHEKNAIVSPIHSDGLSLKQAYDMQSLVVGERCKQGASLTGFKLGLTSEAKRIQMGVDDIILGELTSDMAITTEDAVPVPLSPYIHPRIEPEIAFLLKAPLSGEVSRAEAIDAIEASPRVAG